MKKLILKLFLALMTTGCSDYELSKITEYAPEIEVTPDAHDYGHLFSGKEKKQETVLVRNIGNDDLILNGILLENNSQNFSIITDIPDELFPGEELSVVVEYDPKTFETNNENLKIFSNDKDESLVVVSLLGIGDAPVIRVMPDYYDFDIVYLGCEDNITVDISNIGNVDLTIEDLEFFASLPANFGVEDYERDYGSLPIVIPPGTNISLEVNYLPDDMLDDSAYIEISSDDPVRPLVHADQDGMGDYEVEIIDNFDQNKTYDVDLLFVVDNSGSMATNQYNLKNNFENFINAFASAGVLYQIAIITTDSSDFVGPVIDSSNPDPVAEFNSQIDSIGTRGSVEERGLWYAYESTTSGQAASSGFIRTDARLVVVYVSDEPDRSRTSTSHPGGSTTMYPHDYSASLRSIKVSSDLIVAHAIAGDYPSGCTGNGNAEFGEGYYEVVRDLGGTFMSICSSDWSTTMDTLARDSIMSSAFMLSEKPVEDTIRAKINGVDVSDWVYEDSTNSIIFGSSPPEGSDIEVAYGVLSCQ